MVGWIWKRAAISDVVWSPLRAARATLDLNDALYCLRFLLMILFLVEMMNQSLGTCPNFGVHFNSPPCGDDESELRHLSKFRGPLHYRAPGQYSHEGLSSSMIDS